jgi:hypothetical protein
MPVNARDFLTRFATAVNSRDKASLQAMFHPEFTAWSPQSGERSRGFDGFWAQMENYPGGPPEMPQYLIRGFWATTTAGLSPRPTPSFRWQRRPSSRSWLRPPIPTVNVGTPSRWSSCATT